MKLSRLRACGLLITTLCFLPSCDSSTQGLPLTIEAGEDRTAKEGATVQFTVTTEHVRGDARFLWSQISGPSIEFPNSDIANTSFVAPAVASGTEAIVTVAVALATAPVE